jgi:polar amino acid transport system permease protein
VQIAFFAYAFGVLLGLCGAMGKLSGGPILKAILEGYTTLVRAVPELVLILLLYYAGTDGLNNLIVALGFNKIEINGLVAAVFVLGFVQGAYHTEVLRAAILAVPVGQSEAAKAYGMSPLMRFRRITLPAMLPNALPGLANLWLNVTKDSALISVVGFTELALATRQAAGVSKQYMVLYLVAQAFYLCISLSSNLFFRWLERHVRRGQPKLA